MEKIVDSALQLSAKGFSHRTSTNYKILVKNSVFAIQQIGNRKRFLKCLPTPIPLHTVVVLYYIHHIKMACLVTRGNVVKMLKRIYYKSSLVANFVQTCS